MWGIWILLAASAFGATVPVVRLGAAFAARLRRPRGQSAPPLRQLKWSLAFVPLWSYLGLVAALVMIVGGGLFTRVVGVVALAPFLALSYVSTYVAFAVRRGKRLHNRAGKFVEMVRWVDAKRREPVE